MSHFTQAPLRTTDEPINTDRLCPGCGYNLRGLRLGGRCPECGRIIREPKHIIPLIEAPRRDLVALAYGLAAMIVAILGGIALWLFAYYGLFYGARYALLGVTVAAAAVAGWNVIGWWAPGEGEPLPWHQRLRIATHMLLALVCASAVVTILLSPAVGLPIGVWLTIRSISMFLWIMVQAVSCMTLMRLAKTADDDPLAGTFWNLSWALGLCGGFAVPYLAIIVWIGTNVGVPVCCLGGYFLVIGFLVAEVWYLIAVFRLQRRIAWAVKYQDLRAAQDQRLRERVEAARGVKG